MMPEFDDFDDMPLWVEWDGENVQHLKAGRVYLAGEIGEAASPERYIDILADRSGAQIELVISSGGGAVDAALAIIRAVQRAQLSGKVVRGVVRGMAASMALVILQVCDERIMHDGDALMAHGSTTALKGDSGTLEQERNLLLYWHDYFAALYAARTKHDADYWKLMFESDTRHYYTATEALEERLVDRVVSSPVL